MVGRREHVNSEVRRGAVDAELRKNIIKEISVQGVVPGEMANVVHPISLITRARSVVNNSMLSYFFTILISSEQI